jgi:hypothetical protein
MQIVKVSLLAAMAAMATTHAQAEDDGKKALHIEAKCPATNNGEFELLQMNIEGSGARFTLGIKDGKTSYIIVASRKTPNGKFEAWLGWDFIKRDFLLARQPEERRPDPVEYETAASQVRAATERQHFHYCLSSADERKAARDKLEENRRSLHLD